MKGLYLFPAFMFTVFFNACNFYPQDDYQEQYVVESYLIEGEPIPPVRLTTTVSFDREYVPGETGVSDARVRIHLLDEDGRHRETTYILQEKPFENGVYETGQNNTVVEGRRTYELEITFPDSDEVISAETIIPGPFEVLDMERNSAVYQSDEQLSVTFSTSTYPGRQSYYIFATKALDMENFELTPFWQNAENDQNSFEIINSGIINQENYVIENEALVLRYPWIGIAYYGPNEINTYAIDDNVYDFYRSQSVQLGGSTLSPGEIPNIIYNVDGGIGLFGGMAGAGVRIFISEK